MKNLLATVLGACVAMLVTSGVVALATAQSDKAPAHERLEAHPVDDETLPDGEAYALSEDELDQRISALIDAQYLQVVEKRVAL
ncbi:MAG: hypothetical protein ACAI38_12010 [Myxococcota bacterium]